MPKKKSVRRAAQRFRSESAEITALLNAVTKDQSEEHISWLYEYGLIKLYRGFELLMLEALVGAINNDTAMISSRTGVAFPKHLTDEVCEFIVIGDGFFDFKGRDGLIRTLRRFIPETHYLVDIVKKPKYKAALEQLSTLRNFAAHESSVSRKRAKEAIGQERIGSAGSWLKRQDRWSGIMSKLDGLAVEIEGRAPF